MPTRPAIDTTPRTVAWRSSCRSAALVPWSTPSALRAGARERLEVLCDPSPEATHLVYQLHVLGVGVDVVSSEDEQVRLRGDDGVPDRLLAFLLRAGTERDPGKGTG